MDKDKQIELVRKRNIELVQQLEDLKKNLNQEQEKSNEVTDEYKTYKQLINELEKIKTEWLDSLNKLKQYEKEYSELISDLKLAKKSLKDIGVKIPSRKKLFRRT